MRGSTFARTATSVLLLFLAGCQGSLGSHPSNPGQPAGRQAAPSIYLIVLENHGATVLEQAPFLRGLASRYAIATNYHAVAHPSLPNYLALTSGSTWGVEDNDYHALPAADIGSQMTAAKLRWRAYMEGMGSDCQTDTDQYVVKHDPFAFYGGRCAPAVVPLDGLDGDLARATYAFTWITPDLCHDMHDCDVEEGDTWLAATVPAILASPAWLHGGVLYITFDEDDESSATDNLVPLVVVSSKLKAHTARARYDHYSLLATIEDALGLPRTGKAAQTAPITGLLG